MRVRATRVTGERTGRIGVLVAPAGSAASWPTAAQRTGSRRATSRPAAFARGPPPPSRLLACSGSRWASPAGERSSWRARPAPSSASTCRRLGRCWPTVGSPRSRLVRDAAPDVLFATRAEAEALVGGRDLEAMRDLAPIAVVKRGSRGRARARARGRWRSRARLRRGHDGAPPPWTRRAPATRSTRGSSSPGWRPTRPSGSVRRRSSAPCWPGTGRRRGSSYASPGAGPVSEPIGSRWRRPVAAALAAGRPVVALESTLISHGLPYPQNLEVARASEAAVVEAGAVPATVAIHDGRMLVGLDGQRSRRWRRLRRDRLRRPPGRRSRRRSTAAAGLQRPCPRR